MTYNVTQQLTSEYHPLAGIKTGAYDPAGNRWCPTGRQVALAATTWIRIVDVISGQITREWPVGVEDIPRPVLTWSPDGMQLAVAGTGHLVLLDCVTGAVTKRIRTQDKNPERVSWSPNGLWLAVRQGRETGWPTYTSIYDVFRGRRVRRFRCLDNAVIAEWSPDGSLILMGAGKIRGYLKAPGQAIIDVRTGKYVAHLGPPGPHWMGARWVSRTNTIYAIRRDGEEVSAEGV